MEINSVGQIRRLLAQGAGCKIIEKIKNLESRFKELQESLDRMMQDNTEMEEQLKEAEEKLREAEEVFSKEQNRLINVAVEAEERVERLRKALATLLGDYEDILYLEFATDNNIKPWKKKEAWILAKQALEGRKEDK